MRVPDNEWDGDLVIHNLPRPKGLIECDTVVDLGAGIRPMNWYKPQKHICVEPHKTYADRLRRRNFDVQQDTALNFLLKTDPVDAIYLLDVIEHMFKEDGLEVLKLMQKKAKKQIVIYTPLGFMPQDDDGWGLDGKDWQTHRSGWHYNDFPGWQIQDYGRGFFAVLTI